MERDKRIDQFLHSHKSETQVKAYLLAESEQFKQSPEHYWFAIEARVIHELEKRFKD